MKNTAASLQAPGCNPEPAFEWRVRVYYEDTDAGGIVYYANYLRFFERARTEWLRAMGADHANMAQQHDLQFVVRSLAVDYRRPARLDDELMLTLRPVEIRGASMRLEQNARASGDSDLLVGAQVRLASVRCSDGRPTGLPQWLLNRVTP